LAFQMLRKGHFAKQFQVKVFPREKGESRFGSGVKANLLILLAVSRQLMQDLRGLLAFKPLDLR
jgi:hypothetical protein